MRSDVAVMLGGGMDGSSIVGPLYSSKRGFYRVER